MSKYLKIGEISKLCDISIKTLRYYEEMGLIKPVEVDIWSGYRYYDEKNVDDIYKIQFLKDLGLPLKDIKDFDDKTLKSRLKDISKEIKNLRRQRELINSLINLKGEKIMKPFINDEQAIGKWCYIGSALSKEQYLAGDMIEDRDILFKELVFMPEGEGYWVFKRWSKGEMYHFRGMVYTYEIEDGKLFLSIYNDENEFQLVCVYEKVDSKEYKKEELQRKDNTDLPFVLDENAVGEWEACEFVDIKDKYNFIPKGDDEGMILKSLSLFANGTCFLEYTNNEIAKIAWTKDYILSHKSCLASNYIIKEVDGEMYLIMDWKSGDYVFGGEIFGCYVFKKQK